MVGEHRAAEVEVRDIGKAPDGGRWWLATRRCSGSAGAVMRARGRAAAQANCEVRQCTG
jgi:hypothetical protein